MSRVAEITRVHAVCLILASVGRFVLADFRVSMSEEGPAAMRFSRNQIIGAILLLTIIWLVIAIRFIIAR